MTTGKTMMKTVGVLLMAGAIAAAWPSASAAQGRDAARSPLNAFLVTQLPEDYAAMEKFFFSLREGGADAVIIGSTQRDYVPDRDALPNLVYLAHQARLKIFLILPVRNLPAVLDEHPEWEDLRFDPGSGTIQPTGRLDLFRPEVVAYLADRYREIASYFVDGIFFGVDFYYGDTEGMSPLALQEYKKRYDAALVPGRAFARVDKEEGKPAVVEYGGGFKEWTALKTERLVATLSAVMTAAKAVNRDIQFGIPLHVQGLSSSELARAKYAYDGDAFAALKLDYYWLTVLHRNIKTAQGLPSYRKGMEELGRLAQAASAAVKEPCRVIIMLQTSAGGKMLPYSEIEEAAKTAKKPGELCVAYLMNPSAQLPASFTRKLFKR